MMYLATRAHRRRRGVIVLAVLGGLAVASVLPALPAGAAAPVPGRVVGWGVNWEGQADSPAGLTDAVAVAAGDEHSMALRADGTVVAWGADNFGETSVPAGLSGVVEIAAHQLHSMALRADGTVVAWGYNRSGQLDVPAGLDDAVAIDAGEDFSLALRANGRVVGWGATSVPSGLADVVAIGAGYTHALAVKGDGTVVGWGGNGFGEATPPAGLTGVVAVAGGGYHSLALRSDGTVVAWGNDRDGQIDVPAGLSDVVAIAAGAWYSLALRSDGTVVSWGYWGQDSVPSGLGGVVAIDAGAWHSLAITTTPAVTPRVVPGTATVTEGNSGSRFVEVPVTLSAPSDRTVTVDYVTLFGPGVEPPVPATPGVDFGSVSGTVTFAPGETAKSVAVPVYGDRDLEPDEWIVLSFGRPVNARMGGYWGLGFGVIANDDVPAVVPATATVTEGISGSRFVEVPVTLSAASDRTVTVDYVTLFGPGVEPPVPATPGVDFGSVSGTVTFAPGETAKTVAVPVFGDTAVEPDEWIVLSFGRPVNARMGGYWGLGFGVIANDD